MTSPARALILRLVLSCLAIWPTVSMLLVMLRRMAPGLPLLVQTLILSGLLVPISLLVIAPCVNAILSRVPLQRQLPSAQSCGDTEPE